jgi:hypothetical protein
LQNISMNDILNEKLESSSNISTHISFNMNKKSAFSLGNL